METDAIYFSRRAEEERLAATQSPHPSARQAHLDMAERYEEFATAIGLREHNLRLTPSHS